jgi:hypothetical protein
MLTGKLPFPSNYPLDRHQIYSEIPAAISEKVMNLLANALDCFEESDRSRTYAEIAA